MADWMKVGTDVAIGGGAGVIDQLLQNQDEKREAEKGAKLGVMTQFGTYYNYGLPILAILANALGFFRGAWAERTILVGSQLAGRKVAWQFTKRKSVPYTRWSQRQIATREPAQQVGGPITGANIPIISDAEMLV